MGAFFVTKGQLSEAVYKVFFFLRSYKSLEKTDGQLVFSADRGSERGYVSFSPLTFPRASVCLCIEESRARDTHGCTLSMGAYGELRPSWPEGQRAARLTQVQRNTR